MSVSIEYRPFTAYQYNPDELGHALSAIVNQPKNRRVLKRDFPNVVQRYKHPQTATETVQQRQQQMIEDPGFGALAIIMSSNELDPCIVGVRSYSETAVRRYGSAGEVAINGVLTATWKDLTVPREFTYKGPQLLERAMTYLVHKTELVGKVVTLIRPKNQRSMHIWMRKNYNFGDARKFGEPFKWYVGDGVNDRRQLFVTNKSLGQMRRDSVGNIFLF